MRHPIITWSIKISAILIVSLGILGTVIDIWAGSELYSGPALIGLVISMAISQILFDLIDEKRK